MRKLILLLVLLASVSVYGFSWDKIYAKVNDSIMVILNHDESGFCTGIVFKNRRVLTAAHCFRDDPKVIGIPRIGDLRYGEATNIDRTADLAVVEIDTFGFAPIKVNHTTPLPGLHVLAVGFISLNAAQADFVEGFVLPTVTDKRVFLNFPLKKGYSGGPLVTEDGELVGVNIRTGEEGAESVSIKRLEEFLDKVEHGKHRF